MPIEAESSSVIFTSEAESALLRLMKRFERDLRVAAIDEAVRTRGVPVEVTSTDINKAYGDSRRIRADLRRRPYLDPDLPPDLARELFLREVREKRSEGPKSPAQRLASVYVLIGVIVTVLGIAYPPLYKLAMGLLTDPVWKRGLLVSAVGLGTAIVGFVFKMLVEARIEQQRREEKLRRRVTQIAERGSSDYVAKA